MKQLILTLALAAAAVFAHAADSVVTETVNDLAPYTAADDSSYWTVSTHPAVTVRVTTAGTAVSAAAIFGECVAAAIDTRISDADEGFLEILSTISPVFMLLLR